jgi:hypothetical protein
MAPTAIDRRLYVEVQPMALRLLVLLGLLTSLTMAPGARAQTIKVLETSPVDHATISGTSTAFFVRFDKPVDHIRSRLVVTRGSQVVANFQRSGTDPAGRRICLALVCQSTGWRRHRSR